MRGASNLGCDERASLQRLAEALGGTVESLFGATADACRLSEMNELLRIRGTLTKDASRGEALRAVQDIATAEPK